MKSTASVQGEFDLRRPALRLRSPSVCGQRLHLVRYADGLQEGTLPAARRGLAELLAFDCPFGRSHRRATPLLQANCSPDDCLADAGGPYCWRPAERRTFQRWIGGQIIMDLKCPDSGECESNRWANLDSPQGGDEIKFVIRLAPDFDWAGEVIRPSLP